MRSRDAKSDRRSLLIRCWAAPCLLLLVAAHQVYRVHVDNLTPWKGGGFGMFATTARGGGHLSAEGVTTCGRAVHVILDFGDGEFGGPFNRTLRSRLGYMASAADEDVLLRSLLEAEYVFDDEARMNHLRAIRTDDPALREHLDRLAEHRSSSAQKDMFVRRVGRRDVGLDPVTRTRLKEVTVHRRDVVLDAQAGLWRVRSVYPAVRRTADGAGTSPA